MVILVFKGKKNKNERMKQGGKGKGGERPNASLVSGYRSFAVRLTIQFSWK